MSSDRKIPDDRELEDFLAGKHPAGRAYREASEGEAAPRELDDAILRMAREHAATSTATTRVTRRPRWLQPLAVAATLALSLGVLMNIWRDPTLREQIAPMEEEEEATPDAIPAGSVTSRSESAQPIEAPAKPATDADLAARQRERRASVDQLQEFESRPPKQFATDEALNPQRRYEPSRADTVPPSATSPRANASMAPAAPPPPPPAPATRAGPEPFPGAASSGAGQSRPDIDPHALKRDDRRYEKYSLPDRMGKLGSDEPSAAARRAPLSTTGPSKATAPAPPAPEPEMKKQLSPEPVLESSPAKEKSAVGEPVAEDAAAAGASLEQSKEERPSRESLVERARAALARGNHDEARRLVADLRRLYPETPLPEDLRAFAPPER